MFAVMDLFTMSPRRRPREWRLVARAWSVQTGTMQPLRFLIVDDHPLFLEALEAALHVAFPGALVETAGFDRGRAGAVFPRAPGPI